MKVGSPERLTFFCELESEALIKIFSDKKVIGQLQALHARISLGIVDFSEERASVVRLLNKNGIPVVAWQLLPREQGYWYNMSNAAEAVACYQEFLEWTNKNKLRWAALGVDIEPDIAEVQNLIAKKIRSIPRLLQRIFRKKCFDDACKTYHSLVTRMQNDGYLVESYEFLFMDDDRRAGSCLLGRLLGVAEVPADTHVLMLYSSFFRPYGVAVLCSYACGADSVAVGVTGGGVELQGIDHHKPLNWGEFSRDLRLAWRDCKDIQIFSLEGCIEQGFMDPLINFDWSLPVQQPRLLIFLLRIMRLLSSVGLWFTIHPYLTGGLLGFGLAWLIF